MTTIAVLRACFVLSAAFLGHGKSASVGSISPSSSVLTASVHSSVVKGTVPVTSASTILSAQTLITVSSPRASPTSTSSPSPTSTPTATSQTCAPNTYTAYDYTATNGDIFHVGCGSFAVYSNGKTNYNLIKSINYTSDNACIEACSRTPTCVIADYNGHSSNGGTIHCNLLNGTLETKLSPFSDDYASLIYPLPKKSSSLPSGSSISKGAPSSTGLSTRPVSVTPVGYSTKSTTVSGLSSLYQGSSSSIVSIKSASTLKTSSIPKGSSIATPSAISTSSRLSSSIPKVSPSTTTSQISSIPRSIIPTTTSTTPAPTGCETLAPTYTARNGDVFDVTCGSYIEFAGGDNQIAALGVDTPQQCFENCTLVAGCTVADLLISHDGLSDCRLLTGGNQVDPGDDDFLYARLRQT